MKITYTNHTTSNEDQASTGGILDAKIAVTNSTGQICFYRAGFPRGMNEAQVKSAAKSWIDDLIQRADVEGDTLAIPPATTEQGVREWAEKHPELRFCVWAAFLEGNSFTPISFEEALIKARLRQSTHENDRGARIVVAGGTFPAVYVRCPRETKEEWSTRELPTDATSLRIDGPIS